MTTVNEILMGRGGRSASFKNIGDSVAGEIVRSDTMQQRDIKDGKPLFWDDGKPKESLVLSIQTGEAVDDEDDGIRNVYVKVPSQMLTALRIALRQARAKGIENGAGIRITYVSEKPAESKGMSPAKQYEVAYEPPTRVTTLPADGDAPYCGYHHVDLMQSPRTGKWGHMVNGQACFGVPAEDESDVPF